MFFVTIPVYNAEDYISNCLESVYTQKGDFQAVVVDDASTDGTCDILEYTQIPVLFNTRHIGSPLANIIKAIKYLRPQPEDVIVNVDGDDELKPGAIEYLAKVYKDPHIWMTYGSYTTPSKNGARGKYCQQVSNSATYRKHGRWCTSHLRTYKKWLFDLIKDEDLRYNDEYFKAAGDMALMYPMIEMSDHHAVFISKVLYLYNDNNPLTESGPLQRKMIKYIRSMPKYAPIQL